MIEKQVPFNLLAERGLLGSLIIDPAALDQVLDLVQPADFYRECHRLVYEAILSLHRQQMRADYITLCDELERVGQLENLRDEEGNTGALFVNALTLVEATSALVVEYAEVVACDAEHRRRVRVAGEIARLSYAREENAQDQAEQLLQAVVSHRAGHDFEAASQIIEGCWNDLLALHNQQRQTIGLSTGFRELNNFTSGFQKSDLIIVAGRPAMGKSSLMLSFVYSMLLESKARIGLFSLEMSKQQLMQRLWAMDADVPLYRLRTGDIAPDEWERINASCVRLSDVPLWIDDTGGLSLSTLRSRARRLKSRFGLDALFIDYLQLMRGESKERGQNREQEIAEISRGLKALARELDIPVVALAQLSRSVESRENKRPMLSDLRESGSLEQDTDLVLFVYRDVVYHPDTADPEAAEVILAKQRNGPTGHVDLRWNAPVTRFEEVAR